MVTNDFPVYSLYEGHLDFEPLILRYLAGIEGRLESVGQAIASRDSEAILRATHSLRGSSSIFGFPQVAASISRLEQLVKVNSLESTDRESLKQTFHRLVSQCSRLATKRQCVTIDIRKVMLCLD
jgi:HPt (histidine-containing phosphotransfer) domain-containing protein